MVTHAIETLLTAGSDRAKLHLHQERQKLGVGVSGNGDKGASFNVLDTIPFLKEYYF